jgi:uncharacterized damage-inducible protein DinB
VVSGFLVVFHHEDTEDIWKPKHDTTLPGWGFDELGPAVLLLSQVLTIETKVSQSNNPMVQQTEAAPYYFRYINLVAEKDILAALEGQLDETLSFLSGISEETSLHRYAPDKWSIRQVMNHVNDVERVFLFRALWFARGFSAPLPGFDQEVSSAKADDFAWSSHVDEFRTVRLASVSFFRNLPREHWSRTGIADDNPFTVNALAHIIAGHMTHHRNVLEERYL